MEESTVIKEKVSADVIYKALLKNNDPHKNVTSFEVMYDKDFFVYPLLDLSHLVNQANEFNEKNSDYDVIKDYIKLSGNCQEIMQLVKDISAVDSLMAALTFKALYHILIRIASDLNIYIAAGTSIVNEVLSYGMKTIFNFLKSKQKASRTKVALHLLASMVALNSQTAHQVVAKLDFTNVNFTHLLNRTNFSEEENVRTSFLNLIILILSMCNNNVIRQIVEVKGFLNHVFPGLISDFVSTITLVLDTFRAKIIENPNIPKTSKVRLFTDHSLTLVIKLYTWKGPLRNKTYKKRKLGEEANPIAFEVSDEEAAKVHSSVHHFMLALCCSKTGIIFNDASLGLSGKNLNHTITNILKLFKNPYSNHLISEFVVTTLKACPDQLRFYLPIIKDTFKPRLSASWVKAVKFLKEIMDSQDLVTMLFQSPNKRPVPVLLDIARTFCMLDILNEQEILEALNNGHHVLCYYLCCYISNILEQVDIILNFIQKQSSKTLYNANDLLAFQQSFISLILKNFPIMNEIQSYWCKITVGSVEKSDEINLDDLDVPSLSEELSTILKVMKMFQSIYLKAGKECNVDLTQMLSNVKQCNAALPNEDIKNVYINIVDLLSAQNPLALWNKETTNTPLMIVVELYQSAHKSRVLEEAKDVVYKVLLHTKVFDQCKWEIDAWLDSLESSKSRHIPYIFEFINEALLVLFQEPKKFQVEKFIKDSCKVGKKDTYESNDFQAEQQQCFSNFVPAVLSSLHHFDKKGCQLFVERALVLIMHHQHSPQNFFRVIKPYKSVISPSLFAYWEILSSPQSNIQDKIQNLSSATPCVLDLSGHLRRNFMANHSFDTSVEICSCNLINLLGDLDVNSVRKVIWQILIYIDFEATLMLDEEQQCTSGGICSYITLLQQLIKFLLEDCFKNVQSTVNNERAIGPESRPQNEFLVFEIMKETLEHPVILKLFIDTSPISLNLKDSVVASTKLVLNMTKKILDDSSNTSYQFLLPFKKKIIYLLQDENFKCYNDIDLSSVLDTFSLLFTATDIVTLLENLLSFKEDDQELSSVFLLMKIFLEKKDPVLLTPKCFSSIISKYTTLPKKLKKILRSYILELLNRHPEYALLITEESALLLVQQKTTKDLELLGKLINSSDSFRQIVQQSLAGINAEEQVCIDFIYLASKCILECNSENASDTTFKELILSSYWKGFSEYILDDGNEHYDLLKECCAGKAAGLLLQEKYSSPKRFNSFCKMLLGKVLPSSAKMCVLIQFLESWKFYEGVSKTVLLVLKVACSWLNTAISEDFDCFELTTLIKEVLQGTNDKLETTDIIDINYFSKSLKVALKQENIGKEVLKVLSLLCEKSKDGILPVQSIYNLVTGHSSFFQVMLSDKIEENDLKESLIDLLTILTKLDKSVCKENHIGLLLSSYEATMSAVDQKLLFLMKLYSDNGVNMVKYSPFLWGKPAIGHYSVMNSTQMYLWKQPKLQDVLSLFLPEMIDCTTLNYPLDITLQPQLQCLDVDENVKNKIYDLRFILHLFANLLAPGCFVHCHKFVESRVLMLIFSSLSCHDLNTRALGYYCLSQFYHQLESENFREKKIWLCLLDSIRNSISSVNPRIPCIITLFLARVADIFTKPDHHLFLVLSKFITVKPCLDITQVPEFFKLFNSIDIEHRIHRQWLLSLIGDGLRTSADFHICEKRYIFNTLQHYFFTSLSTTQEKLSILHIITSAVKIQSTSRILCERGLLVWIQGIIMQGDVEVLKSICLLMTNLQKTIDERFKFQFTVIHSSLLEKSRSNKGS